MVILAKKDVERLQELGRQIAEIAESPLQDAHRKIWTNLNDGNMSKPALIARDYPRYTIEHNDELTCLIDEPFFRNVESEMLQTIYEWKHMRCHRVVENVVLCPTFIEDTKYGIEVKSTDPDYSKRTGEIATAKHFNPQILCEEDLEKIEYSKIEYNEEKTMKYYAQMKEIFDGILEVKLFGISQFRCTPWDDLLSWMGIEEGMYGFVENPEFMEAAVKRYMDISIDRAKRYEQMGLVSSNNTNFFMGNGGYGYSNRILQPTKSGIGGKLKDNWGDVADQIFTSISPNMSRDFAFAYEREFANLFFETYYGCCERLDNKVDLLKREFPNLRKISMSPYCNIENGMEKLGGTKTVFSFKPNSNYLAGDEEDMNFLKDELTQVCELAIKHNCQVEILMKTIITLRGDPKRLWRWCDMATQIIDSFFK